MWLVASQPWGEWMMGGGLDWVEKLVSLCGNCPCGEVAGVLIDWGQASGYDWSSVPWGKVNSHFMSIYEEPASRQASFALTSH